MSEIEDRSRRVEALARRMPNVPGDVLARMQAHLRLQDFPVRGLPATMQDVYARLDAAGLPPEQITEEIYHAVGVSRTRLRTLLAGLRLFAPDVPLAPAAAVSRRWDAWLNAKYNAKPRKARTSRLVGLPVERWPTAWAAAVSSLDRTVRPYGTALRRIAPKTRESVISAVGMLAASRSWAEERGVEIDSAPSEDLFEGFVRYLLLERAVSFRTVSDYVGRLRIFFLRAGLFDERGLRALAELTRVLVEEASDRDPGKWQKLRAFRTSFGLADILHRALSAAAAAALLPAHGTAALRLRQKAMVYAFLVNAADRQGDLRGFRIGQDIIRGADGLWLHGIRQSKTGRAKELGPLWSGTSALIDAHLLADRPGWTIEQRVQDLDGANLLTLGSGIVNKGFINRWLKEDFQIHGHLVRTLVTDFIRRERPDARWAAQHMLGHSDRTMQEVYRSDFAESAAILGMDRCLGKLDDALP